MNQAQKNAEEYVSGIELYNDFDGQVEAEHAAAKIDFLAGYNAAICNVAEMLNDRMQGIVELVNMGDATMYEIYPQIIQEKEFLKKVLNLIADPKST